MINPFFEQKSTFCTIGFVLLMFWDFHTTFTMFYFLPLLILFNCEQSGSLNWIYTFSMLFGFLYFCLTFDIFKCDKGLVFMLLLVFMWFWFFIVILLYMKMCKAVWYRKSSYCLNWTLKSPFLQEKNRCTAVNLILILQLHPWV